MGADGFTEVVESLVDEQASNHVTTYDAQCVHYNLIADGVYLARRRIGDPLSPEFEPYIIAGLLGFDMGRDNGKGRGLLFGGLPAGSVVVSANSRATCLSFQWGGICS